MRLPLLISVPHAGLVIPKRLRDRCILTPAQIAEDGDVGAREIYAYADHVAAFFTTEVARAALDMNRAEDDVRRDGVVKTHTCWNVPIWREPLDTEDVQWLLETHHRPYHAALRQAARDRELKLGVDLHTMAAQGPPVGPDYGEPRPAACVGDANGACPPDWSERLARLLAQSLGHAVTINEPFSGGFITRSHAAEMPWVQIELSRGDFLSNDEKRNRVLDALRAFCDETLRDGS